MQKIEMTNGLRIGKQDLYELIFRFVWLMTAVYFVVRPILNNSSLTRAIWLPSLLLIVLFSLRIHYRWIEFISLIVPGIILLFSVISQTNAKSEEHILAIFCYIGMIIVLMKCSNIIPSQKTFDFIFCLCVFLSVLFISYSFTSIAHTYESYGIGRVTPYLVFNLGNSNTASMFLYSFLCVLMINIPYRKHKWFLILLVAYDFFLIYGTNSRSTLAATLLVIIVCIFFSKKRISKWVICVCVFFPILFAVVYLYMFYVLGYVNFDFMDKTFFSGRQIGYLNYLAMMKSASHYLFGNFVESRFQNAENAPLAIFASIGIIGLVMFYTFFLHLLFQINENSTTRMKNICLICILGIFIESCTEASFFLGGFPGVIMMATFFLLGNYADPNKIMEEAKLE